MAINFTQSKYYDKNYKIWKTATDLFEGDHETMANEHLIKHSLEKQNTDGTNALWNTRKERSFYTNYISKIYQRYIGILFKEPLELDDKTTQLFTEYNALDDVDGNQNSLTEFLKYVVFYSRYLYGDVYVLVDAPQIETETGTKLEADLLGKRPFLTMLNPLQVKDFQKYEDGRLKGKFKWVRYEYTQDMPREFGEKITTVTFSKVFSYNVLDGIYTITTYKHDKNGKPEIYQEPVTIAGFEQMPISFIQDTRVSYCKDLISECLKHYNYDSCISNILHFQGYQDKSIIGTLNDDYKKAVGEYVTTFLPEGATVTVIDPCDPVALRQERDRAEANIWRMAFHQTRILNTDSKAVESADTQRVAKEDLISILISELHKLESLMNKVVKDFAQFTGVLNFDGVVTLDKDLDIEDLDQMLEIELAYAKDIENYPSWKKEVLKKKARMMNLSNEDEVIQEIDTKNIVVASSQEVITSINE